MIILADDAEASSQIDVERARLARALAQERIAELGAAGDEADGLQRDLQWAEARIAVGSSH